MHFLQDKKITTEDIIESLSIRIINSDRCNIK